MIPNKNVNKDATELARLLFTNIEQYSNSVSAAQHSSSPPDHLLVESLLSQNTKHWLLLP